MTLQKSSEKNSNSLSPAKPPVTQSFNITVLQSMGKKVTVSGTGFSNVCVNSRLLTGPPIRLSSIRDKETGLAEPIQFELAVALFSLF